QRDCGACAARALCTQAKQVARILKLQPQAHFEALHAARAWYASDEGQQRYKQRAGVERTLSQGVRAFRLRRTLYRAVPRTNLEGVALAWAVMVDGLGAGLEAGPRATTRLSRFAALAAASVGHPGEAAA